LITSNVKKINISLNNRVYSIKLKLNQCLFFGKQAISGYI